MKGKSELEIASLVSKTNEKFNFSKNISNYSLNAEDIEKYYNFFIEMGLKNLFLNLLEKSVKDYVIGVLVGLDTNGRKNRSGSSFELLCNDIIKPICLKYNITLLTQKKFEKLNDYGFSVNYELYNRKADFILIKENKVLNIETNYYFASGSKPEEIVDSYVNRSNELSRDNIAFILLTDGLCWDNEDKNQLNKAFKYINIMNCFMAGNGYLEEKIKEIFKI